MRAIPLSLLSGTVLAGVALSISPGGLEGARPISEKFMNWSGFSRGSSYGPVSSNQLLLAFMLWVPDQRFLKGGWKDIRSDGK